MQAPGVCHEMDMRGHLAVRATEAHIELGDWNGTIESFVGVWLKC